MNDHGFQLARVRIDVPNSRETTCFTATIRLDGEDVGRAKNDGHGGLTMTHFYDSSVEDHFDAVAMRSFPDVTLFEAHARFVDSMLDYQAGAMA